jgi:hypothetical protein
MNEQRHLLTPSVRASRITWCSSCFGFLIYKRRRRSTTLTQLKVICLVSLVTSRSFPHYHKQNPPPPRILHRCYRASFLCAAARHCGHAVQTGGARPPRFFHEIAETARAAINHDVFFPFSFAFCSSFLRAVFLQHTYGRIRFFGLHQKAAHSFRVGDISCEW